MSPEVEEDPEAEPKPFRILPKLAPDTEFFWTSGEDGRLRFLRCARCRMIVHPPSPLCPRCMSHELWPEPVSGRATVLSFTVNHQAWIPGFDPPYVFAVVEIDEQRGVRLFTNIVGCPDSEVEIGMRVTVRFERYDDVWIPLFEPAGAA